MKINRLMTNICSRDLQQSRHFYTTLFSFSVAYDSDWFVHLRADNTELELGLIAEGHQIVPEKTQGQLKGVYLTFVIDDVEAFYDKAQQQDCVILQAPEPTDYGQMRMLIQAPEGTVCDVSSPISK